MLQMVDGGYDDGYRSCGCFWGDEPGSLVSQFFDSVPDVRGMHVLDAGCGEGKNAYAFSSKGAIVTAVDCSEAAISNGKARWANAPIEWRATDVRSLVLPQQNFDVVISYGLFHCFGDEYEVLEVLRNLKAATKRNGFNLVCAFNDREQDLRAHPGFEPCLLPHVWYQQHYDDWEIISCTDEDLFETHPHNNIPHRHSLTRILAKREK